MVFDRPFHCFITEPLVEGRVEPLARRDCIECSRHVEGNSGVLWVTQEIQTQVILNSLKQGPAGSRVVPLSAVGERQAKSGEWR